jgi:hypothetical protein
MKEITTKEAQEYLGVSEFNRLRRRKKAGVSMLPLQDGRVILYAKTGVIEKERPVYKILEKEDIIRLNEIPTTKTHIKIRTFLKGVEDEFFTGF